jgi:uncharacterized membrane protein YbhN (UPF0104 family)
MIFADVWAVVADHAASFLLGLLIGWVVASRYRIVRVNGKPDP